ncbi:MAG: phage portal protein [Nitrosomonas sp.]|nr:phage portal protein [Nitrosomonas sp.]
MNFKISSLIPWGKKSATTTHDLYKELLDRVTSKSGVSVNWKTALNVSTVFACARVIAEGLAQVPFKLYKKRPGGRGSDIADDHSLYELLYLKPNEWQTSFELREQIGLHLAIHFNAYIYKVRGLRGEIVELLPFSPESVRIIRDGWDRRFEVYDGKGGLIKVSSENMWHIRGPSWDGVIGMEAIKLAREAIGLALAAEEHGARMFSNGARTGGVLSTESKLNKEDLDDLRQRWQEMQGGNQNAYRTAILSGGLKWQSLAMTGVDGQHLEQRRFQVEEICRSARVMPIMIGHSDKAATYASAEAMFGAHVKYTLLSWYARVSQSASVNLLTDAERKEGYYPKFVVNALMQGATKDRADYYTKMCNIGAMNPNEVRDLEEMNPYHGGDEYRVAMNTEKPGDGTSQEDSDNSDKQGNDNGDTAS